MKPVTPSQTIGPFWHPLADPTFADLTRFDPPGPTITLTGVVSDGDGAPITDACIELWCGAWGRCATGPRGEYAFTLVRPDAYAAIAVLARGLVKPLWTRVYFVDPEADPGTDPDDPLLASLPPARRQTLIARPDASSDGAAWRWDVRLQGDADTETVFLEL
jgi:protocatechuate 3,4-dioxygenase alpha subunit